MNSCYNDNANGQFTTSDVNALHQLYGTPVAGGHYEYQGDAGWWNGGGGYRPDRITHRTVSGDYDGDGRDDIAMFYEFDDKWGIAHVLLSKGSSFEYQGDGGWWYSGRGYDGDKFAGRMVSGDFNADGRDDIAMYYEYSSTTGRTHVLLARP